MADDLSKAGQALGDFASGPVTSATNAIEAAVDKSFDAVARTIARAAASGKLSMDQLVDAILADFERVAVSQFIVKPIEGLVSSLSDSFFSSIGGALAGGGPVNAGETYLVGEQGPELFTPGGSGTITSNDALKALRPSVVVNVQATDAASFLKSQSQIASAMSRALAKGQRNL
ncbi:MAG TPA: phage tail tape measure C-terminal domain-containing protein [Rhizomicrobium sp.]|nr:phage tail tape measure C-terminal domain-containing protein [Rhizomicrobium sp.]